MKKKLVTNNQNDTEYDEKGIGNYDNFDDVEELIEFIKFSDLWR